MSTDYKPRLAGAFIHQPDGSFRHYHPDLEEDQREHAVQCECCKIYDSSELMKDCPEGWYCLDCWEDIYG